MYAVKTLIIYLYKYIYIIYLSIKMKVTPPKNSCVSKGIWIKYAGIFCAGSC